MTNTLLPKVIYYQARPVGVHDILNYYWNGTEFKEETPTIIDPKDFDAQFRAACAQLDERYNNGCCFFGSENLLVEDVTGFLGITANMPKLSEALNNINK